MPYLEFVLHPQVRPATVERRPGIVGRTEIDPEELSDAPNAAVTCSGQDTSQPMSSDLAENARRSDWTSRLGNPSSSYVRSSLAVTVPWVASQ